MAAGLRLNVSSWRASGISIVHDLCYPDQVRVLPRNGPAALNNCIVIPSYPVRLILRPSHALASMVNPRQASGDLGFVRPSLCVGISRGARVSRSGVAQPYNTKGRIPVRTSHYVRMSGCPGLGSLRRVVHAVPDTRVHVAIVHVIAAWGGGMDKPYFGNDHGHGNCD